MPEKKEERLEELVKQRTEEVRISEVRYHRLFEVSKDGVLLIEAESGRVLDVNKFMVDLLGLPKEYFIGKKAWELGIFKNIEISETTFKYLRSAQVKDFVYIDDLTLLAGNGKEIDTEFTSNAYDVDDKKIVHFNFRDIGRRKLAEASLHESEARFKAIFDYSRDGLLLVESGTRQFFMWNQTICKMLGYTEEEMKGLVIKDIHPEEALPHVMELFERQARGESVPATELPVKRKDGGLFYADINSSLLLLNGKEYLLGSFRDVTERKELEDAKNEFINTVSHELRTPLTIIMEAVALVANGSLGAINVKQKEMMGYATKNVDRLERFINQVLDFQALDSGRVKFKFLENDINEVIEEVRQGITSLASKKGLDLTLKLDAGLPRMQFDKDKIIEVLVNIIGNAVKFTEKGGITLTTARADNSIIVSIADTGCGIKEEDMPKLFQQFVQIKRMPGGSGLGLAISKGIIDAHGGKIWIESVFGKGTTFHFILPIVERRK